MHTGARKRNIILFLGDIVSFFAALWLMLVVRYQEFPSEAVFNNHLLPFSFVFIASIAVFFIAGLYEKRAVLVNRHLPGVIFNAQIMNTVIAVLFFYFIPFFGITPKTNLFIYLIVSSVLLLVWRVYGERFLSVGRRQNALLLGSGSQFAELEQEIGSHPSYNIHCASVINVDTTSISFEALQQHIEEKEIDVVVLDIKHEKIGPLLSRLSGLVFSQVQFVDVGKLYEEIFDRVPVAFIRPDWVIENVSAAPKVMYDFLKRLMDVAVSFGVGLISLILYPIVWMAIKLDDGGKLFIVQERIGKDNQPIRIFKFRTMAIDDAGNDDKKTQNKLTRVGPFLRKTRIDELPQLWNVLKGDLSLIGPRPELPSLVKLYNEQIPYYAIRHILKPGLSGWAQLYHKNPPKVNADYNETRNKLSYDLFYIKNRSLWLDIKISLKTIKTFLSRSGL